MSTKFIITNIEWDDDFDPEVFRVPRKVTVSTPDDSSFEFEAIQDAIEDKVGFRPVNFTHTLK